MDDQLKALVELMRASGKSYAEAVHAVKSAFIKHVLLLHNGNQCRAARELGIHRNRLSGLIAQYQLRDWMYQQKFPMHRGGRNAQR